MQHASAAPNIGAEVPACLNTVGRGGYNGPAGLLTSQVLGSLACHLVAGIRHTPLQYFTPVSRLLGDIMRCMDWHNEGRHGTYQSINVSNVLGGNWDPTDKKFSSVNSYGQDLFPTCKAFPKETTTCIWFTQSHEVCNGTTVLQEVETL